MASAIGKILGKTSTMGFDFLIEQQVNKWDYITVQHAEVGPVLAQVREIVKKDNQTVAHCEIIGYRTDRGFLRKPRTPFEPGAQVFITHDDFLKATLGLTEGGLYLGLLEGKDHLKAFINPRRLITQHLAVLAKSGSGKCLHPQSEVILSDGSISKIGDIVDSAIEKHGSHIEEGVEICNKGADINILAFDLHEKKQKFCKVTALMRRPAPKRMIKLTTRSGRSLITTKDHPILTMKGDLCWIEAKKLQINDKAVTINAKRAIVFDKIVKTEEVETDCKYVYDLETEFSTFISNNIIIHNSYAIGVLLEELADLKVPIVVIDPHGEYSSIKLPNKHPEDTKYFQAYGISAKGYRPQVREFAINTAVNVDSEQLKLSIPDNPLSFLQAIPFKLTNTQKGLLYNAIEALREKKPQFNFADVIEEIELNESPAKWSLITGLQNLQSTRLFSFQATPAEELVKQGQLTIVNLKGAPTDMQEMVVASLAGSLFEYRKVNKIPPFFMVIEEAHNFAPERGFGEALSSKIIRTLAAEGRKFGLGLGIVSQRSARTDKSVLSQTASQIILQVTNPNDLKAVSTSFEGVSSETEDEVKNLPIGKALVIGAADYPIFVDIRVRKSQHGGRAQTFEFSRPVTPVTSYAPSSPSTTAAPVYTPIISQEERSPAAQPEMLNRVKVEEPAKCGMTLSFAPRIFPKDIVMMETEDVEKASLILRPCISVRGRKGSRECHIVVDLINFGVYAFEDKLKFIEIPSSLQDLSVKQKMVIKAVADKHSTVADIFAKTKLSFAEVSSMVDSLLRQGLLQTDGKSITVKPELQKLGQLDKINFPDKPEYMDLPAQKLPSKLNEKQVELVLNALGVEASAKVACYMPFYHVQLKGGRGKIVDALSYSLGS